MKKQNLNENFICRIWENTSYYSDCRTKNNDKAEVLDPGQRNPDAGPDYQNARIRIAGKLFSGSVEIHRSASDWLRHGHKKDGKYNEVILHVVFYENESDDDIINSVTAAKSRIIPTLILSQFLNKPLKEIWKEIISNPSESFLLPCHPDVKEIPQIITNDILNTLSIERIEYKSGKLHLRLKELASNTSELFAWEQTLFEFICEALGYSKNKKQFVRLAQSVSLKKLKQKKYRREQLDSVLFGISGFLEDLRFKNTYIDYLKSYWISEMKNFKVELIRKSEWNFFRLRPSNFPTLRIAYASALLFEILYNDLLKKVVTLFRESSSLYKDLILLFKEINVSDYWKKHYNFGKPSSKPINSIGTERLNDIISNVVLPLIHLYAGIFKNESLGKRVMYFFKKEKISLKGNEVTRIMEEQTGKKINTFSDEQSLIQLHNFYCVKERCRECEIGKIVFEKSNLKEPLRIIIY